MNWRGLDQRPLFKYRLRVTDKARVASDTRRALDRTMLAVFDLPYGAVKRHVLRDAKLPTGLRRDLEAAVRAVIDAPM